jgi:hypothetical protein
VISGSPKPLPTGWFKRLCAATSIFAAFRPLFRVLVYPVAHVRHGERGTLDWRAAMQETQVRYAIKFVADMDKAVKFYRDVLGLEVNFESPGWSEFVTGATSLALHPASDKNPAERSS